MKTNVEFINVEYLNEDEYRLNFTNDISVNIFMPAYNDTKTLADDIEHDINLAEGSITWREMFNALKALKDCIKQHQPKPMREIAEEHNLELIEVTHGRNGYPSNIKEGIIGFDTFEQAEEIAAEYDCEVVAFHRRDGWQLWENIGTRYEPFDNLADDEDVCRFDNAKDAIEFLLEEKDNYMDDYANDCLDIDEEDYKNELKKYDDEIAFINENWEEGKVIVGSELLYMDVLDRYTMGYYDDTHHYVIGIYRYC